MVMSGTFHEELRRNLDASEVPPALAEALVAQRAKLAALEPPASASPGLQAAVRQSVDGAFVSGFRRVMGIAAALALLSSISALLMIGEKRKPPTAAPIS
jgi:hypothetical protein